MRRELRSRHFDVFTMSFLDTICCAFGAVILLFMLSKFGEPAAQEKARVELEGRIAKLQEEREEIRGTSEVLLRELAASQGELTDEQRKIARLRGDLSALRGKFPVLRTGVRNPEQARGRARVRTAGVDGRK